MLCTPAPSGAGAAGLPPEHGRCLRPRDIQAVSACSRGTEADVRQGIKAQKICRRTPVLGSGGGVDLALK